MMFEWDEPKNTANQEKHGVSFEEAQLAFADPSRVFASDEKHSTPSEKRLFCYGLVNGKVLTVRFTIRDQAIRIFGAAFWRQGVKVYDTNK